LWQIDQFSYFQPYEGLIHLFGKYPISEEIKDKSEKWKSIKLGDPHP